MALPPFKATQAEHEKFMERVEQWEKIIDDAIIWAQVRGKGGDIRIIAHEHNVGLGKPNAATMAVLRGRFTKAGWKDLKLWDEIPGHKPSDPLMTLYRH